MKITLVRHRTHTHNERRATHNKYTTNTQQHTSKIHTKKTPNTQNTQVLQRLRDGGYCDEYAADASPAGVDISVRAPATLVACAALGELVQLLPHVKPIAARYLRRTAPPFARVAPTRRRPGRRPRRRQ